MAVRKVTSWQAQEPQDTLRTSRREEFGTITLLTHVYRAFPDSISELACFGLQLEVVMACAIWVSYLVFLGFSRIYRRCPCYETPVSLFLSCSSELCQFYDQPNHKNSRGEMGKFSPPQELKRGNAEIFLSSAISIKQFFFVTTKMKRKKSTFSQMNKICKETSNIIFGNLKGKHKNVCMRAKSLQSCLTL